METDGTVAETRKLPTEEPALLKDKSFHLWRGTVIRLSTLVMIMLWLVSIAPTVMYFNVVDPLQEKVATRDATIGKLQSDVEALKVELKKTKSALEATDRTTETKIPILISPINNKSVIGSQVKFRWHYKGTTGFTNYILQIQRTNPEFQEPKNYQVPDPHRSSLVFTLPPNTSGRFFWRVRLGAKLGGDNEEQRWSDYGSFVSHPTILDRIKNTGQLLVGTTPSFISYDHPVSEDGRPDNLDMRVIDLIAERLGEILGILKIRVKVKSIPWLDLLKKVQDYEVDLAIASITSSDGRERRFSGIKFSDRYIRNYQAMIGPNSTEDLTLTKADEMRKFFEGKWVGVQKGTINEKAARELAKSFGFKIKNHFNSYVDIYPALREGTIDFALVDSVQLRRFKPLEFGKYLKHVNVCLDEYLKDFYKKELGELGADGESYAIAVAPEREPGEKVGEKVWELINRILKEPNTQEELRKIEKKVLGSQQYGC